MSKGTLTRKANQAAGEYRAAQMFSAVPGVPASLKFHLAGIIAALEGAAKRLESEERALIDRLVNKDEDGNWLSCFRDEKNENGEIVKVEVPNSLDIPRDRMDELKQEMNDLHEVELEVSFMPVPIHKYFDRLDEKDVVIPEGVFETLLPYFAAE